MVLRYYASGHGVCQTVMLPVGAGSVTCFESLARGFVERYRDQFKQAVEVFAQGLGEALTYLDFPGIHQRHIKSTNAFVCYLTPTPRV
jgi:hypothetical protein